MKRKDATAEIVEQTAQGGRIRITTPAVDRYGDRVLPEGAVIDNYMKNPVVQWGHNYTDPWATIGNAESLDISANGIVADFKLREPANEADPMHIIKALWEQGLIKAASIGFNAVEAKNNEHGGYDFESWELLEFSLVPIPANQEALRLAVKSFGESRRDAGAEEQQAAEVNTADNIEPVPDDAALVQTLSDFIASIKAQLEA